MPRDTHSRNAILDDENVNWRWCDANSTFKHRDACEFIVNIGTDVDNDDSYFRRTLADMSAFGCTDEFMLAYRDAAGVGAIWVLFYAG